MVNAAKCRHEFRIGRISAATQDSRTLCRFALGATRPIRGASDTCSNRPTPRGRKKQRHRGAEERDKETRSTDNSSTGAPRCRAAKSVLGLCFIPIIQFSPLVLIVGFRSLYELGCGAGPRCWRTPRWRSRKEFHPTWERRSGTLALFHLGGRARTRTGTPKSWGQILSLLCLPFHHAARVQGLSILTQLGSSWA